MTKLSKHYWTNSKGERMLNCYNVTIKKEAINKTNITDKDELNIYPKDNKIIIEKKK